LVQKISTSRRVIGNSKEESLGEGGYKARIFNGKYELKLEFREG